MPLKPSSFSIRLVFGGTTTGTTCSQMTIWRTLSWMFTFIKPGVNLRQLLMLAKNMKTMLTDSSTTPNTQSGLVNGHWPLTTAPIGSEVSTTVACNQRKHATTGQPVQNPISQMNLLLISIELPTCLDHLVESPKKDAYRKACAQAIQATSTMTKWLKLPNAPSKHMTHEPKQPSSGPLIMRSSQGGTMSELTTKDGSRGIAPLLQLSSNELTHNRLIIINFI